MTFSEYRDEAMEAFVAKGLNLVELAIKNPNVKMRRIDDICASFWRSRSDIFNDQCLMELAEYVKTWPKKENSEAGRISESSG